MHFLSKINTFSYDFRWGGQPADLFLALCLQSSFLYMYRIYLSIYICFLSMQYLISFVQVLLLAFACNLILSIFPFVSHPFFCGFAYRSSLYFLLALNTCLITYIIAVYISYTHSTIVFQCHLFGMVL